MIGDVSNPLRTVSHRRRTRSEWCRILSEYEGSGQTQGTFCAERGIAYSSFCNWRKRLIEEGSSSPLIELPIDVASRAFSHQPDSGWRIELEMGEGMVLRIR